MERDSQRSKVYDAQDELPEYHLKSLTLREAQLYANEVVAGPVWKAVSPSASGVVIKLNDAHNARYSFAEWNGDIIKLHHENGLNEMTVLHEIGHTLVIRRWYRQVANHGPEWAWIYRTLMVHHLPEVVSRWDRAAGRTGVQMSRELVEDRLGDLRQL